jgi:DNA (cytosine-5)-methyltransferase 1
MRARGVFDVTQTIELFAGIAGFSSPHTQPVAFVEKEPACRAVLRRHYPHALILDDVRTVGAHNLPWARVLKGGFPCQDLSVAGNRAGLSGARSGLFYEITRIADELRPDYLIWENVPGLLSSGAGRDFLAVLTELDRIGFAGGWTTVDAQFFGVAQRRQRVFGVFARRDIGAARCAEILSLAARLPWNLAPGRETRKNVAARAGTSFKKRGGFGWSESQGVTGTLEAEGGTHQGGPERVPLTIAHTLTAGNATGKGVNLPGRRNEDDYNLVLAAPAIALSNRGRETGATFETLRAGSHGALPMVASAQSASHGGADDNDAQAGHIIAFTERGREGGRNVEWQSDLAYTQTNPGKGGRAQERTIAGGFGVRRLTPRECERLQGFPDDYTAWGVDEQGRRVEMSDSVRYRMLGNAVCRKVSAWIDSQLVGV